MILFLLQMITLERDVSFLTPSEGVKFEVEFFVSY